MPRLSKVTDKDYLGLLENFLSKPKNDKRLFQAVVDAPFQNKQKVTGMGLGIVVLLLVNKETNTVDRIALSDTYHAIGAVKMTEKPFRNIKIPVSYDQNIIIKAIKTGKPQETEDWKYLFIPDLSPESARFNQAGADIKWSAVYPLIGARDGGALIFSYYHSPADATTAHHSFMQAYSSLAASRLAA